MHRRNGAADPRSSRSCPTGSSKRAASSPRRAGRAAGAAERVRRPASGADPKLSGGCGVGGGDSRRTRGELKKRGERATEAGGKERRKGGRRERHLVVDHDVALELDRHRQAVVERLGVEAIEKGPLHPLEHLVGRGDIEERLLIVLWRKQGAERGEAAMGDARRRVRDGQGQEREGREAPRARWRGI